MPPIAEPAQEHAPAALEARDVSHRYGQVVALDHVSVRVEPGRSVALVGESGSGKTTLLRCFNRLVEPDEGVIAIDGVDVCLRPAVELRRHVGYVPQHGGLLPHWRVIRNVALVPTLLGMTAPAKAAEAALELVGLPPEQFGERFPHELSGGERQRAALARALAARPGTILLDEPFGALDAITRSDLWVSFGALRRTLSATTLLVTHDLTEAAYLADELVVMRRGRIEQVGTLESLMAAPATEYVASLLERAFAGLSRLRLA
jgi:osmoprotectant transport system ATP-binding protein